MKIELDGVGRVNFRIPQQQWFGDEPQVTQTASFAGHKMIAIAGDAGAFDLHYLNFQARGFKSIEDAKKAAPEFARKVLARMSEMVSD